MTQLENLQDEVYEINRANGWFDTDRSFGDDIALLHSEVSEALEAFRKYGTGDVTLELCLHPDDYSPDHLCKPEGVGSELADVLVRLLDTCERYNINLSTEINRKLAYNRTRGYRHGGKNL